ncbi:hypothetical protein JOE44_001909 [Chryseobacterium sp. PvR013]|uniref:hypothetical protein n=1 Tax=Chryseobacterium sp. PvR013 TaxID=2806595 RepID=UPI001AE8D8E0|nr:hypothetical protein [Chryseobacterium sp. PvR013]MBP1165025.1 hypothetical protein [Chryseobacterium sp. PvR013]
MKKQIQFLIDKFKYITDCYNVFIKYEFNSDIEIHFVQLYSNSLEENFIEQITDTLYNDFIAAFPNELVAIMDEKAKYKFRFDVLFDNTKNDFAVIIENTTYESVQNSDFEYFDFMSDGFDSDFYLEDFTHNHKNIDKDNLYTYTLTDNEEYCLRAGNNEFALAA